MIVASGELLPQTSPTRPFRTLRRERISPTRCSGNHFRVPYATPINISAPTRTACVQTRRSVIESGVIQPLFSAVVTLRSRREFNLRNPSIVWTAQYGGSRFSVAIYARNHEPRARRAVLVFEPGGRSERDLEIEKIAEAACFASAVGESDGGSESLPAADSALNPHIRRGGGAIGSAPDSPKISREFKKFRYFWAHLFRAGVRCSSTTKRVNATPLTRGAQPASTAVSYDSRLARGGCRANARQNVPSRLQVNAQSG